MSAQSKVPPKRRTGRRATRDNGPLPGILVDRQIRSARKQNLIKIDPFEESSLEPATYDLRVGDRAAVSTGSQAIDLRKDTMLTIEPGAMAIVQSLEVLTLSPRLAGRLGPKTSLLRRGIFVATGPQIDPGFHGRIIVNLINLTSRSFVLRHSMPFLSVEFHYLSEAPDHPYTGDYQDRLGLTAEELNILYGYEGPNLAEIYRGFAELRDNIRDVAAIRPDLSKLAESMQSGLRDLRKDLASAREGGGAGLSLSIQEFGEEKYEVIKPILVVVQPEDGEFLGSFFEANIHATGETDQEAYDNLRLMILDTYESMAEVPESDLAPVASQQWKVLQRYVRRRGQ